ncbi:MAG TPA: hypothetical protein VJN89_07520 [Candidatus Acidoferrum sp.]|nr:hypothetical protein [Candidatus Acidoferrum sp.]
MPPKNPGTSYTGKPVRRLKLPKIGPTKTINFFEEYLYALLAIVFFAVTVLGKAGGFSTYNAVVIGAWMTAILWSAHQLKEYFAEKSKAENGKTPVPQPQAQTQAPKGPVPLPPGMKPMIGLKWPVKPGARPSWPKQAKEKPTADLKPRAIQPDVLQGSTLEGLGTPAPETNSGEKKRGFVYERPTLPDRKPKMPNNWADPNGKDQKDKKRDNKKPKR